MKEIDPMAIPNQNGMKNWSINVPINGPTIWAKLSNEEPYPLILPCTFGETV